MTKVKFCGLTSMQDIESANRLKPDYIGFVYAAKSRRRVSVEQSAELKSRLSHDILSVGVFLDDEIDKVVSIAEHGIIDVIQLHGNEDEKYISTVRRLTKKPIIRAFVINTEDDAKKAENSSADYILLDGGKGNGTVFDWNLLHDIKRPYFLAGGLNSVNVADAVRILQPFAVDVSSGIETDGKKDYYKMDEFINIVRKEEVK